MTRGSVQTNTTFNLAQEDRISRKLRKGIGGVVVGSLITLAGILLIAFPISAVFIHPGGGEDMPGPVYLERVTPESSRVYGILGLILGPGLIWFSRWPRWGKRNAAVEDYVWGLSQELSRRFGVKNSYAFEDVSRTARECGYRTKQIAYAHAIFCSRDDFKTHYQSPQVTFTYDDLRDKVARRYFCGAHQFDAASVVRLARPPREEDYDLAEVTAG